MHHGFRCVNPIGRSRQTTTSFRSIAMLRGIDKYSTQYSWILPTFISIHEYSVEYRLYKQENTIMNLNNVSTWRMNEPKKNTPWTVDMRDRILQVNTSFKSRCRIIVIIIITTPQGFVPVPAGMAKAKAKCRKVRYRRGVSTVIPELLLLLQTGEIQKGLWLWMKIQSVDRESESATLRKTVQWPEMRESRASWWCRFLAFTDGVGTLEPYIWELGSSPVASCNCLSGSRSPSWHSNPPLDMDAGRFWIHKMNVDRRLTL